MILIPRGTITNVYLLKKQNLYIYVYQDRANISAEDYLRKHTYILRPLPGSVQGQVG